MGVDKEDVANVDDRACEEKERTEHARQANTRDHRNNDSTLRHRGIYRCAKRKRKVKEATNRLRLAAWRKPIHGESTARHFNQSH